MEPGRVVRWVHRGAPAPALGADGAQEIRRLPAWHDACLMQSEMRSPLTVLSREAQRLESEVSFLRKSPNELGIKLEDLARQIATVERAGLGARLVACALLVAGLVSILLALWMAGARP
jgi:hypothetical protein